MVQSIQHHSGTRTLHARITAFGKRFGCSLLEFFFPWAVRWICAAEDEPVEEYPKKPQPRSLSLLTGTRWIISLVPILLGCWVSIDGAGILQATEYFLSGEWKGGLYWSAGFFWGIAILWTRALYIRLKQEDRSEQRYRADLVRALYSLPNLNVLWQYERYHRKVADLTRVGTPAGDCRALGEQIQVALAVIAEMARAFARKEDATYGANIMLVINQQDIPRLPKKIRGAIRFVDQPIDPMRLDGLLVLPEELALMYLPDPEQTGTAPPRNYPLITLPVRREPRELVLPGASTAILSKGMSVYEDTRRLADAYGKSFSEPVRNEIRAYFGPDGEGKDVRSFASIRLDSGDEPAGVLNIDSNDPNVLGEDEDYYATFVALVRPLLHLLIPLVDAFAATWWEEMSQHAS